ncbi:MAG: hypothetical protein JRI97_00785 [Deltaproteobacteria bacterium]|nr:hypothetical protein [Deltaproteobacteria bacterium]
MDHQPVPALRLAVLLFAVTLLLPTAVLGEGSPACPAPVSATPTTQETIPPRDDLERRYGVRILSLRATAGGRMLDLRYKVVDAEKARDMLSKNTMPRLLHESSSKELFVPVTRLGPLRQTTLAPEDGRHYFVLFSSPPTLKNGDTARLKVKETSSRPLAIEVPPSWERPAKKKAE